ncbi:MAG: PA14 domain-containing protein [Planctomycetota bacterium]|nr:PA14 domain-containing protein [Planctomycetota bacterium]
MKLYALISALSLQLLTLASVQAEGEVADWWNKDWQYRKKVRVSIPEFLKKKTEVADEIEIPRGQATIDIGTFVDPSSAPGEAPDEQGVMGDLTTARVVICDEGKTLPNHADLRVINNEGSEVPFNASSRGGQEIEVFFRVNPKNSDYYIYFGNPDATPGRYAPWRWRQAYIQRFTAASGIGHPSTSANAIRAFRSSAGFMRPAYLDQINQLQWRGNVLGTGSFVSVYEAYLQVEQAGEYEFAISAVSPVFVAIDHEPVLESDFRKGSARSWASKVKTEFSEGVHYLRLIHSHDKNSVTLRLGWRPPGRSGFFPIPPSAFVRALPAEEVSFETQQGPQAVFFTVREPNSQINLKEGLQEDLDNDNRGVFHTGFFEFKNLSEIEPNAKALRYEWNFGNDERFNERDSARSLLISQQHLISLGVFQGHDQIGVYTRPVRINTRRLIEPLDLRVDFVNCPNFIYNLERTTIGLRFTNRNESPIQLDGSAVISNGKEVIHKDRRVIVVHPSGDTTMFIPLDARRFKGGQGIIQFKATLSGKEVHNESLLIRKWDSGIQDLELKRGILRDKSGRRMILLIDVEDANKYRKWAPVKWLSRLADTSPKRVLLVGDPMLNSESDTEENYSALLKRSMEKNEESFTFLQWGEGVAPCVKLLLGLPESISKTNPEIVVIAPGLQDILNSTSLADWTRSIDIMIDLARAGDSPAEVILVSPPPLLSKMKLTGKYTEELKKLAAEHHCTFINLFEKLQDSNTWQDVNFAMLEDKNLFLMYPNREGQRKMAALIEEVAY